MSDPPSLDLTQTTFIIPIYVDSAERLRNLKIKIGYLHGSLDTNVIILEHGHSPEVQQMLEQYYPHDVRSKTHVIFKKAPEGETCFYRTKFINEIFTDITTPLVCISDCDSLATAEAYVDAQSEVLKGNIGAMLPFARGAFRKEINYWGKEIVEETTNPDFLDNKYSYTDGLLSDVQSELFIKRKTWLGIGLENENIIYSQEENKERLHRLTGLGHSFAWSRDPEAPLWTLFHPPSTLPTEFSLSNGAKLNELRSLTGEKLKEYLQDTLTYLPTYGFNF